MDADRAEESVGKRIQAESEAGARYRKQILSAANEIFQDPPEDLRKALDAIPPERLTLDDQHPSLDTWSERQTLVDELAKNFDAYAREAELKLAPLVEEGNFTAPPCYDRTSADEEAK